MEPTETGAQSSGHEHLTDTADPAAHARRVELDGDQRERLETAFAEVRTPEQVGPYRIIELINEGGMGAVYKAEQRSPVQRIVALKLIKLGMDTKEVIARFEGERQALAMMDHPSIARVFDGGATETGRPYFVMEYVPGEPITDYCDKHHLSIKQRLKLFAQVCDAVQHAHQKGIIHRDVKPSNILVTVRDDQAVPKVIDFGVAKATSQKLTERTLFTHTGQLIGTPEYMSPEQAEMTALDIDTRSDVYSLGVVLYELLTGALPFDPKTLRSAAFAEIQRIIREVDPPRPSTRLSTLDAKEAELIAKRRQSVIESLRSQLRRELEWIPLKAMRKDRTERYRTASELADDIANYLEGNPLTAAPESRTYRLGKFIRRNRRGVAASAAMFLLLVAGVITTSWQAIRATRAETHARVQQKETQGERDNAQAVSQFLTERVLAGATPEKLSDKAVRDAIVKAMLDPAAASVAQDFKDKPLTEAAVRNSLAQSYQALGRGDLALPHAQASLELRRAVLGENHKDTLISMNNIGYVLLNQGKLDEAEPILREMLERSRRVLRDDHPSTLSAISNMGGLLLAKGKGDEAELLFKEDMQRSRRVLGLEHPHTLASINNMGYLLEARGEFDQAEPLYREALERRRQVLGDDHPDTLVSINNMGSVLQAQGRLDQAAPLYREALERIRRVLGDNHPNTLISLNNFAYLLQIQGKLDVADPLFREALERSRSVLGSQHANTLKLINNLGILTQLQGEVAEAEPLFREGLMKTSQTLGAKHPYTQQFAANHAKCLDALGRHDEAAAVRKEFGLPDPATKTSTSPSSTPSSQTTN